MAFSVSRSRTSRRLLCSSLHTELMPLESHLRRLHGLFSNSSSKAWHRPLEKRQSCSLPEGGLFLGLGSALSLQFLPSSWRRTQPPARGLPRSPSRWHSPGPRSFSPGTKLRWGRRKVLSTLRGKTVALGTWHWKTWPGVKPCKCKQHPARGRQTPLARVRAVMSAQNPERRFPEEE